MCNQVYQILTGGNENSLVSFEKMESNVAPNSKETHHTPTSTANTEYSYITTNRMCYTAMEPEYISTNINEAYPSITGRNYISTDHNEAYNAVTSAEETPITTDRNEAYCVTESDIATRNDEAYCVVASTGKRESDHITTQSNEAYSAMSLTENSNA